MKKQVLSSDSTIYNYTLLHKIGSRHPVFTWATALIISIGVIDTVALGWRGLVLYLSVWAGLQVLYVLLTALIVKLTVSGHKLDWRWTFAEPWPGYFPRQLVSARLINRLFRHLLTLGILISAVMYIWVTPVFLLNIMLLHVLTIMPIFAYSRKFYRLRPDSMLRFNAKDISCYKI